MVYGCERWVSAKRLIVVCNMYGNDLSVRYVFFSLSCSKIDNHEHELRLCEVERDRLSFR